MISYFEKFKILQGLPLPGQKIVFTNPSKIHWFIDILENEKLLELGKEYTVKKTLLLSSATYVWLEEFWDDSIEESIDEDDSNQKSFRLHSFEWELPELNPKDLIGQDAYHLHILSSTYNFTIKCNGKIEFEGDRVLVLETDEEGTITTAYFE